MSATLELSEGRVDVEGRTVELSNLDKRLYPDGTTKGDVVAYYRDVSGVLLPHLTGRPLTMKRFPDGVGGKSFYEKRCPPWRPDWVTTTAVWTERKQRDVDYCVVDDLPTLLWAANLADLELHTMLARSDDLDVPTMVVFDLDPGEGRGLADCARVAAVLRDALADVGLDSVVKSSGSKGLHLHVPLNTPADYDGTKRLARTLARQLEAEHGDLVVSRMTRSLRKGKVLVDWSQNTPHKSTVTPFSLRARERPTVAVPLSWDEVDAVVAGATDAEDLRWSSSSVLDRLDERAGLARPLLDQEQQLPAPPA